MSADQARTFTFAPQIEVLARRAPTATVAELADETGVYSASPDFVREHCGPVAISLLDLVPDDYYAEAADLGLLPNVDVRVHRLYPGDIPAVPGWHADGEFRAGWHDQPDLDRVPTHRHLTATVSTEPGGVSSTEFVTEPFDATVRDPSAARPLWSQVHEAVEAAHPATAHAADGELTSFSSWTLHRATPARVRGWRLFLRMSMWHRPYLGGSGKVSRQEQVYRLFEGQGW